MTTDRLLNPEVNSDAKESNNASKMSDELMTVVEVAKFLRLKPTTIRAMARAGKLPAIKVGRGWRFPKEAIKDFVKLNIKEG